ncbi:MAG: dienelactone hydrolase [Microcoleaceae cyanobacterium]
MMIRAIVEAIKVEQAPSPYDILHLKVFYPSHTQDAEMGMFPIDSQQAPFKIVILFNGINCHPQQYQWLAIQLAKQGIVVVTFSWINQNIPGIVAITPGVDLTMLTPDTYGSGATASAIPTLLTALERLQTQSILAGQLDLQQIIIGGHSAGGRVAIESANSQFFPQIVAAFAYGAHTAAGSQLGYPSGTILPLPDTLPLLLIGGTCDGVIERNGHFYGVNWEHPTTPVKRTFDEAIAGGRKDSYLLLLKGANHFVITHPLDTTLGTTSLDYPATQPEDQLRNLMAEMITLFIQAHVCHHSPALTRLNQYLERKTTLIAAFERK